METIHRRRAGSYMLGAAGALLLAAFLPGLLGVTGLNAQAATPADSGRQACSTLYYALDPADPTQPNPDKERVNGVLIAGAFGTPVVQRGEEAVKAELKERRSCGVEGTFDPALTAALYSEWSHYGLTQYTVGSTDAEVNAFAAEITADPNKYAAVLAELEKLEGESAYSERVVAAGIWSMYMIPDGNGGVIIKFGQTSSEGTNAVFTHPSGIEVRYRLDCGFQPNRDGIPEGVDVCVGAECAPPPVCPPGKAGTWPDCYVPCPPGYTGEREPDCYFNKWQTPTTTEPGWDQRGTDNGVTDSQESARQIQSGETRGNAGTDQTNVGTSGTTGQDTSHSSEGGAVAEDATKGGDDQSKGEVDSNNTIDDTGGTEGATCEPNPALGLTCPGG